MSGYEDRISLAAIILSVAAFIISVGQMLQQYYATAEGYRRCQDSVLGGPWAAYTRRVWRWSEFRFETLFAAPHIRIGAFLPEGSKGSIITNDVRKIARPRSKWLGLFRGSGSTAKGTQPETLLVGAYSKLVIGDKPGKPVDFAKACWLDFLKDLNTFHKALTDDMKVNIFATSFEPVDQSPRDVLGNLPREKREKLNCMTFPTFFPIQQSWDFMPPDALKPLARIDVCDLVVFVRRLGMQWLQFQPHEGLVRAESDQLILTSTYIRSFGCCINVSRLMHTGEEPKLDFSREDFMIPDFQADAMGFGLLPVCGSSGLGKDIVLKIGTPQGVQATFAKFEPSTEAVEHLQELIRRGNFYYAFLDIIPLLAPFMRRTGSQVVRIPQPVDRPSWIFISSTGRLAFPYLLDRKMEALKGRKLTIPPTLTDLVQKCAGIGSKFPCWTIATVGDHRAASQNQQNLKFLKLVHDLWDHIEKYFANLRALAKKGTIRQEAGVDEEKGDVYADLVKVHLRNAVLADSHAERILGSRHEKAEEYPSKMTSRRDWNKRMAETMAQYMYKLECMRPEMVELGHIHLDSEAAFLDAWAFMMVRGFCWQHCHTMVGGGQVRIPSEYWNSRMPIYIG